MIILKKLVNIVVIIIIGLVAYEFLGGGLFKKEFTVECETAYNIETNENVVTCTVDDPNDLISIEHPLTLSLIEDSTSTIIDNFNLIEGVNTITFDELEFSNEYSIELSGYELVEELYQEKVYFENSFSTVVDDFVLPIVTKTDLEVSDTTVSFLLAITDTDNLITSINIKLLDGTTEADSLVLTDFTDLNISFDSLDELTSYDVDFSVTFKINDFDTLTNTLHEFSLNTLKTPDIPEASINITSNDNITLVFEVTVSDMDADSVSYNILLIDESDNTLYSKVYTTSTISIDISSITVDYEIVVLSNYTIAESNFTDIEITSYDITTYEYSNFFAIPGLNIIDITVPLDDADDYDDYLYTNFNQGKTSFRIDCDAAVDCADLVQQEPYKSVPFKVIGMVHAFYDTNNIGYSFTSSYIDITVVPVYTPTEIALIAAEADNIINSIITNEMTTNDKILAVHDYIINNSVYDQECYTNDATCDNDHTAYGILFDGNAVCEGYADTMDIMLRALRIPSIRISSDTHQWNGVYYDGSWLHLDATWDDPVSSGGDNYLLHDYYLIETASLNSLDASGAHTYDSAFISFID